MARPSQPSLTLPRGLILMASAWLVLSWVVTIGFGTPLEASSSSYTPGVRIMLICMAIGLMIAWPMLRLSQGASPSPARQTLLDLLVLLALLQVVVWPFRLVTPWTPVRTAAIDATLASWSAVVGALVASAVGSRRAGPRNLAMLACVGLCAGGPAAAWLTVVLSPATDAPTALLHFGPIMEVLDLTGGGGAPPTARQWQRIACVALAAIVAWAVVATVTAMVRARSQQEHGHRP